MGQRWCKDVVMKGNCSVEVWVGCRREWVDGVGGVWDGDGVRMWTWEIVAWRCGFGCRREWIVWVWEEEPEQWV